MLVDSSNPLLSVVQNGFAIFFKIIIVNLESGDKTLYYMEMVLLILEKTKHLKIQ